MEFLQSDSLFPQELMNLADNNKLDELKDIELSVSAKLGRLKSEKFRVNLIFYFGVLMCFTLFWTLVDVFPDPYLSDFDWGYFIWPIVFITGCVYFEIVNGWWKRAHKACLEYQELLDTLRRNISHYESDKRLKEKLRKEGVLSSPKKH